MNKYKVVIEFVRDVLGSAPADESIKRMYIETKMKTGKSGVSGVLLYGVF